MPESGAAKPDVRRSDFKTDLLGYLCIIKAAIMTSGDLFSVIMNTLTSYDVTVPVFLLTITVPVRKLLKMSFFWKCQMPEMSELIFNTHTPKEYVIDNWYFWSNKKEDLQWNAK